MKIVIEGTKEEIEAIMTKIAQPVVIQPTQVPTQTPIPWWWGKYEITC